MVPLGLLQALGIFALASRRYPECFVLGACSIGYALILFFFGTPAGADARLHVRRRPRLADDRALRRRGALGTQAAMNAASPIGLSVVMPLYNEGARITANVEQTLGRAAHARPVRDHPGQRRQLR